MEYSHKELDFKSLKCMDVDTSKFHIITMISRMDDDKEGYKYYTLYGNSFGREYVIVYSWSRGWDQYGYKYVCDGKKELQQILKDNEGNNNPFINAIKSYLGQEDGVTYHKYNAPKFNYIKRGE